MIEQRSSYPESWYPVMKTSRLKPGQSRPVHAFGNDWLLFRGMDGKPGMIQRYCCHMGADLSNGRVVGNNVECALHGWQFDFSGSCQKIPVLKEINAIQLEERNQISLPCSEAFGIVFAYYGIRPEYELPVPAGMSRVEFGNCHIVNLNTEHHVPCLNTFDIQHYRKTHNRELLDEPVISSVNPFHLGIAMKTRVLPVSMLDRIMQKLIEGDANVIIDCWGGSILTMSNRNTGYGSIIATIPVGPMKSRLFLIPVKQAKGDRHRAASAGSRITLLITALLVRGFLHPDKTILAGMQPVRGKLLDGVDNIANRYWDFYQGLPVFEI